MTDKEHGILEDVGKYLETFSDVPGLNTSAVEGYWARAAEAINEIGEKWKHHPLALKLGVAMYEYLEIKQDAMSKRGV